MRYTEMMRLEKELQTYQENLPSLLVNEGKFALIHDSDVTGIFDTYPDAISAGYKLFKLEPFLVKQIQSVEQIHFLTLSLVV
jgi:hypothetical protein